MLRLNTLEVIFLTFLCSKTFFSATLQERGKYRASFVHHRADVMPLHTLKDSSFAFAQNITRMIYMIKEKGMY